MQSVQNAWKAQLCERKQAAIIPKDQVGNRVLENIWLVQFIHSLWIPLACG